MSYFIAFLPIFMVILTTFFYSYFFVALGNKKEVILAILGALSGFVFIFLSITYADNWGIFVSSVVLILGTLNILQVFHNIPKIKEAAQKRKLKVS